MLMKPIPNALEECKLPLTGQVLPLEKTAMIQVAEGGFDIKRGVEAVVNVRGHEADGVLEFLFRNWKVSLLLAVGTNEAGESYGSITTS